MFELLAEDAARVEANNTTVYILGPMRGKTLYNFPAFDGAASLLVSLGYCVVNPANIDRQAGFDPCSLDKARHDWSKLPDNLILDDIITRDLAALRKCNAFYTLPGWENSIGARAEHALLTWQGARWLNEPVTDRLDAPEIPAAPAAKEDDTNPKDRLGAQKPQLHLIPPALWIWVAKAMENGAKKYSPFNWRAKKVRTTVYISAALRHLMALLDGEDCADDSGLPHEAHIAACMGILLDAKATGNLIDDRPTKGAASKLISQLTEARKPIDAATAAS